MEIPISEMMVGDKLAFDGSGPVFRVLSLVLGVFEPSWRKRRRKPWHLAFASEKVEGGWMLIEALAGGVQEKFHATAELEARSRTYRTLDKTPSKQKLNQFRTMYLGRPYDVTAYFGVVIGYFVKKWFRFSFRIVDAEFMCWETVCAWDRFMGKPLQPNWEYPILHKIMEKLESS